ncbi:hypothetical protein CsSME_00005670 [Camellia sinensis var. sinensis]
MGIEDIPPSAHTPQTEKTKDKGLALPTVLEEQTENNNRTPKSVEHRLPFAGGSSHHFLLQKDYRDRIIEPMGIEIQELKAQVKRVLGDPTEKMTDNQPIPVQSEAASSHTRGSRQRRAKRQKTVSQQTEEHRALDRLVSSPFSPEIEAMRPPKKFTPPKFTSYDGKIRTPMVQSTPR